MSEEENLEAGIAALTSGDRKQAAALFAQIVKENPASERGWYLLGMSVSPPDQREYCFRRVLAINPGNVDAHKQLASIAKPTSASAVSSMPNAPEVANKPVPAIPVAVETRKTSTPDAPAAKTPSKPRQKKSNNLLLWSVLGALVLLVCGLTSVFIFLPNLTAGLVSTIFPAGQPANSLPTQMALQPSMSPVVVASPTATVVPETAVPTPRPTVAYTPQFKETACPFDKPSGANVTCGYLIVPEDRTGDPNHTIELAVAIYHHPGKTPDPEPVIFLQGGPGADAVQLIAGLYDQLVVPFLSRHDFIVFDQRGTGLSKPVLNCDELTKVYLQDLHGMIPPATRNLVYSNAFVSCSGLMSVSGVNLNAYTTVASAADVKDLVSVLGYQKVNLYGASYGTRLALVVMRDYPEIVNTAILDSVVPIETNFFYSYPDAAEGALKVLFDSCQADPKCGAAYPDLETVFWDIVSKLDVDPITLTTTNYPVGRITETVTGSTFISTVLNQIKTSVLIDTVPQSIYRFQEGDYSTLIAAQYSLPFAFQDISAGLYISMMCHEQILATTPEQLNSISVRPDLKDYAWLPFYGDANDLFKACKAWGATGPLAEENDTVFSDIPTLIITGKFDPTTPPVYAQQVASHLSHSYYFEFPNQGHTPTAADSSGCAMNIVTEFLNDPSVEPDRSCLKQMTAVDFIVPYTGEPPLELSTRSDQGISVSVPRGWIGLGDGFYYRGNSPLDITQIGVFEAAVTPDELMSLFSMGSYGYRGMDTPPAQAGDRKANGLTWALYTSTSNSRPVDIAMAYKGTSSLVVVMFCNQDEHAALYKTVFLPMVDSAK